MTSSVHTDRLVLIPISQEDTVFLQEHWSDPQVRRYLWDDRIVTSEQVQEIVSASEREFRDIGCGYWIIRHRLHDQPVGFAGLRRFGDGNETELLYGIQPAHQGHGFATEAARAVLKWGFEECDLRRIYAGTDPPNTDSIRVIERLGMTFQGERVIDGVPAVYYFADRDTVNVAESDLTA